MKYQLRVKGSIPEISQGLWQLHWKGQLVSAPQAAATLFVYAFFHRVERVANGGLLHSPELRRVMLPITDIPAFPLGTLVSEGNVLVAEPLSAHFEMATAEVDFTRENIQLFSRLGGAAAESAPMKEGEEAIELRPGRATAATDQRYNGLLLRVGGTRGGLPYIIPSIEIFRFFWAPTSKWAQLMLDGRFSDPEHYLFNLTRSKLSTDGRHAMLWLRQWMRDADAPFLASIAFDSYAMSRGADIYRYQGQGGTVRRPYLVRAIPPFQGRMNLQMLRRRVKMNHLEFWLVQSIMSCDYRSKIERVDFDRDNDGRSVDDVLAGTSEDKIPIERQKLHIQQCASILDLSHFPHQSATAEAEILLAPVKIRFPGLNEIFCHKLPQTETKYESPDQAKLRLTLWENTISTLGDSSTAAEAATAANLVTQDNSVTDQNDLARNTLGGMNLVATALLRSNGDTIKIESQEFKIEVEPIFPGEPVNEYFLVPQDLPKRRKSAWRYIDSEKKLRKRGVCLRITFTSTDTRCTRVRYLLDFEARLGKQQSSMLFVWSSDDKPIRDEVKTLTKIVSSVAKKMTTALHLEDMNGLCSQTKEHRFQDTDILLKKIYHSVDRFNR